MSNTAPKRGFTLIELLVVISIIAILSVIGITVFSGVQKSARDAKRKADIKAIQLALEQYKLVTGDYPESVTIAFPGSPNHAAWGTSVLTPTTYIPYLGSSFGVGSLPLDPINKDPYSYMYFYYPPGAYGCDLSTRYYVVGAVTLESGTPPGRNGCWHCDGTWTAPGWGPGPRYWCGVDEFQYGFAVGNYR